MTIMDMLITALVGMLVVFAVLIILMGAIKVMALIFSKVDKQPAVAAATPAPVAAAPAAPAVIGGPNLINVSDKDAAMIMAIVADELGTPLNQLRFTSIKLEDQN